MLTKIISPLCCKTVSPFYNFDACLPSVYNFFINPAQNFRGGGFFYNQTIKNCHLTLVNDQLDAQLFYFIIRLLQSSTCFEQRRAHHQEVKLY